MFLLTVRTSDTGEKVVAACDKELAGRKLEEGELVLDLRGKFFYEEGITVETDKFELIAKEVRDAFTSNIVGNHLVERFVESGMIDSSDVKKIAGVKYAMTFRI